MKKYPITEIRVIMEGWFNTTPNQINVIVFRQGKRKRYYYGVGPAAKAALSRIVLTPGYLVKSRSRPRYQYIISIKRTK